MARKSTIKLLLVNESDNEGERLISLFRNAGRVARAHRAASAEDLHKTLEKESWDLLIADDKHPEIPVEQCLEQLKKLKTDIPVIVVRDSNEESALKAGASDVVGTDNDQRLIFAAFRELTQLGLRRELANVQEKLADAEERCELLMDQSQEAIAYVSDGMLVSANSLFCSRFGYDDPDDLDCSPVIDLIDDDDHAKFKSLLKSQLSNEDGSTDFNFTGQMNNGEKFSAAMQLSNAVFDEEPCTQLLVRDPGAVSTSASGNGGASPDHDAATGLYSHDYFLSQLDSYATQAAAGASLTSLLFIGIDKYGSIRKRMGITHSYNILLNIANFIQAQSEENNCLAHFCDDGFTMLLPEVGADKAMQYAKSLCTKLEQHIIEVDNQSTQCTASIGLLVMDSNVAAKTDPNVLVDHAFGACEQVREKADNGGVGNGAALFVATRERIALGDSKDDEALDRSLEEALEDGQFSLTFQPVVSLRGTAGEHYEVTTRMTDENGEELSAEQFLSTLTFSSANTRLDRWIILESTKLLAAQLEKNNDTRLFINLTTNALQDKSLIPWLSVALKAGNIPPQALAFQFVESQINECLKPAKVFSESLKKLGCKMSITAFGVTDDPFKTLRHVGASFAKISNDFTEELQKNGDTQILKAMVSSINEYEGQAIIGGVENASALALLWQIGVDYIQGAYLAAPAKKMDYEFTDIA